MINNSEAINDRINSQDNYKAGIFFMIILTNFFLKKIMFTSIDGGEVMSQIIEIELSDDVFPAMQKDPKDLAKEMRLAAAVKWYELGLLSQGKAAEVAGLSRAEFIDGLSRFGVSPLQETAEEILKSLEE